MTQAADVKANVPDAALRSSRSTFGHTPHSTLARRRALASNDAFMPVSFLVRLFFWIWFGAAIAAGHFLVLQRVPPVGMPLITVALAALLMLVYARISLVRTWVDSLDLRVLVLLHVTRFFGAYLLVLFQRGELPRAFAVTGGVTDIIVATMALPIALAPLDDRLRTRAMVIWNVVGFVGLLLATLSAARITLAHPAQLRSLTYLPLSLLPTFLMPLLLAIHVIIFARTRRQATSV